MGNVKEFDLVTFVVEDQDKAIEFYVDMVGLELRQDEDYGDGARWVEIAPRGSQTKLTLRIPEMFDGNEANHRRALIGSSPQVTFLVDDCSEIYRRLKKRESHSIMSQPGEHGAPV